jgi:mRNA interferase MazF
MRPIYLAQMDKTRPVVVLTREHAQRYLTSVTVAPITSRIRGIPTEVRVGPQNGIDDDSVISCDNITTISVHALGRYVGQLSREQDAALAEAIGVALDLP